MDRSDIQYAIKELSQKLNAPDVDDMVALKRVGRYLLKHPRNIWIFLREKPATCVRMVTDSDWAGNIATRRSTSGNAAFIGSSCIRTTSTTQSVVALSTGEAEFYSTVRGGSAGLGIASLCADFGLNFSVKVDIKTDSSACIGISNRRGAGRIRHIATPTLWLQQCVAKGSIVVGKIPGKDNGANLLTKHVNGADIGYELRLLSQLRTEGRHRLAPKSQV